MKFENFFFSISINVRFLEKLPLKALNFFYILYFYRNLSLCVNYAFNYGKFTAQSVTYPIGLQINEIKNGIIITVIL
jgi:hypothetical protein